MADRYWVGGTGSWSDDDNHWATSSGGSPADGNKPTNADNAIFDTASSTANAAYTVTVNESAVCLDFTMAGPGLGNNVTWAGSSALAIKGSLNLSGGSADITRSYTGAITFNSTSTGRTVDFNGVTMASAITFNGTGGGWTLSNNLSMGSSTFTLTAGTFNDGGFTITTTGTFTISGSTTRVATLSGTTTVGVWTATTVTNLTFNHTGKIDMTSNEVVFAGGGLTYGEVEISVAGSNNGGIDVTGANTYDTLRLINTSSTQLQRFTISTANQIISTLLEITGANNNGGRAELNASSSITFTVNGSVSLTNANFSGTVTAGTAGTWTGTSLGDQWANSGITFTTPVNRYWVHGASASYAWDTGGRWSATSGGGVGASMPLPQDTAIFDANSFPSTGKTITMSNNFSGLPGMNWSAATNSPTLTYGSTFDVNIYGSVIGASGVTFNVNASRSFIIRANYSNTLTFTQGGATFTNANALRLEANPSTAGITLGSDVSITGQIRVRSGTIDFADYNVTAGTFDNLIFTGVSGVWNMGNGTFTLTGSGATTFNLSNTTTMTVNAEGSTIKSSCPTSC